jgi:hypothetical protein
MINRALNSLLELIFHLHFEFEASYMALNPAPVKKGDFKVPLRFQSPTDYPDLGRFADDELTITNTFVAEKDRWNMFLETEAPVEDLAVEQVEVDYHKKRKQRRVFRAKQHLFLQNQSTGLQLEAKPENLHQDLETPKDKNGREKETQFRHVLFKIVKFGQGQRIGYQLNLGFKKEDLYANLRL